MPPRLAALVFVIGIAGLFYLDRTSDRDRKTSWALWIPILWLTIAASRMVSQWMSLSGGVSLASQDVYMEGSPLDRWLFTGMLLAGLSVLARRRERVGTLLQQNLPIAVFFAYCLASVLWSDYSFVAFKRWTKGLGNFVMILVVLTDPSPRAAIKRFIMSAGFVLIPVSVLFIKYFPDYGRGYLSWVWTPLYTGVATDKNGLGYDCLFFGLGTLWCLLEAFRETAGQDRRRQILVHGVILLMVAWLFWKANSATSTVAFMFGAGLMLGVAWIRRPWVVHFVALAVPVGALVAFVILDLDAYALSAVGRDVSLTGRTELWGEVLRIHDAPWLGVGFETYWMGRRADYLWNKYWWRPNQAHNGYIETYLTLGWVGLTMLALMLVSGYRHIIQTIRRDPGMASLTAALLAAAVVYNLTEAAFKAIHPVWIAFLLSVATVPLLAKSEKAVATPPERAPSQHTVFDTDWAKAHPIRDRRTGIAVPAATQGRAFNR